MNGKTVVKLGMHQEGIVLTDMNGKVEFEARYN